jgi:hypothetical protein
MISTGDGRYDFKTKIIDIYTNKSVFQYDSSFGSTFSIDISNDSLYISTGRAYMLYLLKTPWTPTDIYTKKRRNINLIPKSSHKFIKYTYSKTNKTYQH